MLVWMDFWNSGKTFGEVVGLLGIILVTISGIAMSFYVSSLEQDFKELSKSLEIYKESSSYWESQANKAFDNIESYGEQPR